MPATGRVIVHAGVQQGEGRAADRGHRRGAVALERLGDEPQRVRELDVVRDHRQQGPLGERAVADVAALGAAHEAGLAHAEGREVVVVDVALGGLDAEAVDALRLLGGAEREARQHLGLAAGEQAGAVDAREHAGLAGDRPDLVGGAAVGAAACRPRCGWRMIALLQGVEGAAEGGASPPASGSAPRTFSAAAARTAATLSRRSSLACSRVASARSLPTAFSTLASSFSSTATGATSHLGLPAAFCSSSCAAQRLRISSWAICEGLEHRLLVDLLGAGLDHRDGVGACPRRSRSSSDSSVSWSVGLMMNSSPDQADAHGPDRARERQLGDHQRRGGAVECTGCRTR